LGALLVRTRAGGGAFRRGHERDPSGFELESAEIFTLNLSDEVSARSSLRGTRPLAQFGRRTRRVSSRLQRPRLGAALASVTFRDFCNHAVAHFCSRSSKSTTGRRSKLLFTGSLIDDHTRAIEKRADAWRMARAMPPLVLADTINRDGIDILIACRDTGRMSLAVLRNNPLRAGELAGLFEHDRLTRIHYRICDRYTDPPGAEALHTETLVRLPDSQWCYRLRSAVDYSRPKVTVSRQRFCHFRILQSCTEAFRIHPEIVGGDTDANTGHEARRRRRAGWSRS
jgi:predicted O-linked N-acetylglucosamine transferase (SPINDLY family)